MHISATSVDDHLAAFGDPTVAATMRTLDLLIADAMPGRRRALYEGRFWGGTDQAIVGYGHIVQTRPKGEDVHWFLVGLARQRDHYSLYVNAVRDGRYLGHHYEGRLGKVRLGSASITFRTLDGVDLQGLASMMREADQITDPDPV